MEEKKTTTTKRATVTPANKKPSEKKLVAPQPINATNEFGFPANISPSINVFAEIPMGKKLTAIDAKVAEIINLLNENNNYIDTLRVDRIRLRKDGQLELESGFNRDRFIKLPYISNGKVSYIKMGKHKRIRPGFTINDMSTLCSWSVMGINNFRAQFMIPTENIEKMLEGKPLPICMCQQ